MAKQLVGENILLGQKIIATNASNDITIGGTGINSVRKSSVSLEGSIRKSAVSLETSIRKSAVSLETEMRKSSVSLEAEMRKSAASLENATRLSTASLENATRLSAASLENATRLSAASLENSTRVSAAVLENSTRVSALGLETSLRKSVVNGLDSETVSGEETVAAASTSKQFAHGQGANAVVIANLHSSSANGQIVAMQQGAIDANNVTFHFSGPLPATDTEGTAQTWKIKYVAVKADS